MSIRGDILDTLATQLGTITTANSYASNVFEVTRQAQVPDDFPTNKVVLSIVDTAPDTFRQRAAASRVRSTMTVIILAVVQDSDEARVPITQVNNIISDIRKLVYSPISLGSYVCWAHLPEVSEITITENDGMIQMPLEISYWYTEAAP